jgi:ribosomal-protein-alanine N-acetyltransferase
MTRLTRDAALLSRLHAQCFTEIWSEESFASLLANPGAFALVDEKELGFILIQVAAEQSEVLSVGVIPAARRRGIASDLVTTALNYASEVGANHMLLEVDCLNNQAIGLYQRHGFVEVGRRKGYYRHADGSKSDALMFRVEFRVPRVGNSMQLV